MTYEEHLAAVIAQADLGEPVDVWTENGLWYTPFGQVCRMEVADGMLLNVGPVIMARHNTLLEVMGSMGEPPLPTKLRFDARKRLLLTVTAANGEWTWLLNSSTFTGIDGRPVFVGRWPD